MLQILAFIRNDCHILGFFNEKDDNANNKSLIHKNANDFFKEAINIFNDDYKHKKKYCVPKNILKKVINIKDIDKLIDNFFCGNKQKNFAISITKIRNFIVNANDKKQYVEQKKLGYANTCYDFLI